MTNTYATIYNPKSGRPVKATGSLGRSIIKKYMADWLQIPKKRTKKNKKKQKQKQKQKQRMSKKKKSKKKKQKQKNNKKDSKLPSSQKFIIIKEPPSLLSKSSKRTKRKHTKKKNIFSCNIY